MEHAYHLSTILLIIALVAILRLYWHVDSELQIAKVKIKNLEKQVNFERALFNDANAQVYNLKVSHRLNDNYRRAVDCILKDAKITNPKGTIVFDNRPKLLKASYADEAVKALMYGTW